MNPTTLIPALGGLGLALAPVLPVPPFPATPPAVQAGAIFVATSTATVANTASETSLTPTGKGSNTLAPLAFVAGRNIHIRAKGILSAINLPGSLTMKVKAGGTVLASATFTPTSLVSNAGWALDVDIACQTDGAGGTVFTQGIFASSGVSGGGSIVGLMNTATAAIDTTQSQALDITATWAVANAGNTITLSNEVILSEGPP